MSRFSIYQIDHFDPQIAGRKRRRLAALYFSMFSLFLLVFQVLIHLLKINILLSFLITFPVITGITVYLFSILKSAQDKIKVIGELEFTRTFIRKKIADSVTEYDYESIDKIELQRHLPSVTITGYSGEYFSYIIKILFRNSHTEQLVVSNKSIEEKYNISVVNTLRTLKKIIQPEITIIS